MHSLERKRQILDMLEKSSFLTVERAQTEIGASPATIRRDFSDLARKNIVVRGHGGVHRLDNSPINGVLPYSSRQISCPAEKDRIACAAAQLLKPGEVVVIDGGTTTASLARFLDPQTRVVTNSLPLASALNEPTNNQHGVPEVNVVGGFLYPRNEVLLGTQTISALQEYHADWAFLGASGITSEGLLNSNNLVVDTQRAIMSRAKRTAFLVDHSKLNKTGMVTICNLSEIDVLVTSAEPPDDLALALKKADVKVIVA
jgi:DeoR/GlpR family transcriptional regulator of sugar metabolism